MTPPATLGFRECVFGIGGLAASVDISVTVRYSLEALRRDHRQH